jgi:hypothetical protein
MPEAVPYTLEYRMEFLNSNDEIKDGVKLERTGQE